MKDRKRTVLSIEDQADIRRLIRMTMEFEHYKVLEAGHADEGLALARRERPDLILLDVMMPGTNGLSLCKVLKREPALSETPVVMLSALGDPDDIAAGMEAGAKAYLVKPFSPMQLLKLVSSLIGQAQERQATAPQQ